VTEITLKAEANHHEDSAKHFDLVTSVGCCIIVACHGQVLSLLS